jgi:hypothetical protein
MQQCKLGEFMGIYPTYSLTRKAFLVVAMSFVKAKKEPLRLLAFPLVLGHGQSTLLGGFCSNWAALSI